MTLTQLLQQTPTQWARQNPLQTLHLPALAETGIQLLIKREDQLDPRLSGNKLYKLYGHWQRAEQSGCSALISFGGYHSNHLHALAALAKAVGYKSIGVIRGHRPDSLSPTLKDCQAWGMELKFVSRLEYARKTDPIWLQQLAEEFPGGFIIPEGGQGPAGQEGCAALLDAIREQQPLQNSTLCLPCGSGTTLAGLVANLRSGESVLGFSALKLGDGIEGYQKELLAQIGDRGEGSWSLNSDFHGGGFAKLSAPLRHFMLDFEQTTGVRLDPVYTAKMMFGICQLAQAGYWPNGHKVIALHTGGLQGRRGFSGLD